MDTKKEVEKYLDKYFKHQYFNETDLEYKSLVRLLNKAQKEVKNNAVLPHVMCSNCPKVIGLTVGKSYQPLAKHKDLIALINDYGDFKIYNVHYFE